MKKCTPWVLGLVLTVGCSGDDAEADQTAAVNLDADAELEGAVLRDCSDASQAEINEALELAEVLGRVVADFEPTSEAVFTQIDAIYGMTTTLLEGKPSPSAPFTFDAGRYLLKTDTTETGLAFVNAGVSLEADLLDPESYMVDAVVSGMPGSPTFTFASPGPLFSLLAPGAAEASPLSLTVDDVSALVMRFRDLSVNGYTLYELEGDIAVSAFFALQPATVGSLLQRMRLNLEEVAITRGDDAILVNQFELESASPDGALRGTVAAVGTYGGSAYEVFYTYGTDGLDVRVSCPPRPH